MCNAGYQNRPTPKREVHVMPSKPAGAAIMPGWQESAGQRWPGAMRIDRVRCIASGAVVLRA